MEFEVTGVVWEWRGPAPFHFVSLSDEQADALAAVAPAVSYGWGMVPATLMLGETRFTTALWPKDGGYAIPLKDAVRRAEGVGLGDEVRLTLRIDV